MVDGLKGKQRNMLIHQMARRGRGHTDPLLVMKTHLQARLAITSQESEDPTVSVRSDPIQS